MKQFNLEEWKKNPERKVQTRDGLPVRIICIDKLDTSDHPFPIIALVTKGTIGEFVAQYDADGKYEPDYRVGEDICFLDLFFVPVEHIGYIALYKARNGTSCVGTTIFKTEAEAKAQKRAIGVIKITWEE